MSTTDAGDEGIVVTPTATFTIKPKRDMKVVVGGSLTIIAGILVISNGLGGLWSLHSSLGWPAYFCGVPITVMGIIAVIGGVCALKDVHFSLSLAGAFLAALGDGLTTFLMGMAALLLFFMTGRDL